MDRTVECMDMSPGEFRSIRLRRGDSIQAYSSTEHHRLRGPAVLFVQRHADGSFVIAASPLPPKIAKDGEGGTDGPREAGGSQ